MNLAYLFNNWNLFWIRDTFYHNRTILIRHLLIWVVVFWARCFVSISFEISREMVFILKLLSEHPLRHRLHFKRVVYREPRHRKFNKNIFIFKNSGAKHLISFHLLHRFSQISTWASICSGRILSLHSFHLHFGVWLFFKWLSSSCHLALWVCMLSLVSDENWHLSHSGFWSEKCRIP